jgi:hypothetical protein
MPRKTLKRSRKPKIGGNDNIAFDSDSFEITCKSRYNINNNFFEYLICLIRDFILRSANKTKKTKTKNDFVFQDKDDHDIYHQKNVINTNKDETNGNDFQMFLDDNKYYLIHFHSDKKKMNKYTVPDQLFHPFFDTNKENKFFEEVDTPDQNNIINVKKLFSKYAIELFDKMDNTVLQNYGPFELTINKLHSLNENYPNKNFLVMFRFKSEQFYSSKYEYITEHMTARDINDHFFVNNPNKEMEIGGIFLEKQKDKVSTTSAKSTEVVPFDTKLASYALFGNSVRKTTEY